MEYRHITNRFQCYIQGRKKKKDGLKICGGVYLFVVRCFQFFLTGTVVQPPPTPGAVCLDPIAL